MSQGDIVGLVIDGKYRLDRKLGEGGMGAVYLGHQMMVDRHVAIKLLHSGLNQHQRIKQRFEVEAKAIGRMHHPNCITLFDFGFSQDLDAFYMVMEYLDGTPMHDRVIEGVDPREAVDIARQIAVALDHAHHQGILHRDLKPENVMLTHMTDGTQLVKVLDFGIARIFADEDEQASPEEQNRLTRAGEVFGTPAYISPEQARGERDLTPASDLYSLGVILYEMLKGRLPFWGDTPMSTIMQHITTPVPPLDMPELPAPLTDLTYTLLSKDAAERPQSGRAVAEALAAIDFDSPTGTAHRAGPPTQQDLIDAEDTTQQLLDLAELQPQPSQTSRDNATFMSPPNSSASAPNFGATQAASSSTSGSGAHRYNLLEDDDGVATGPIAQTSSGRPAWLVPAIIGLGIFLLSAGIGVVLMDTSSGKADTQQDSAAEAQDVSTPPDAEPERPVAPTPAPTDKPEPEETAAANEGAADERAEAEKAPEPEFTKPPAARKAPRQKTQRRPAAKEPDATPKKRKPEKVESLQLPVDKKPKKKDNPSKVQPLNL